MKSSGQFSRWHISIPDDYGVRYVCMNGMIIGSNLLEVSVPHKGDVVGSVLEEAFTVVENFKQVDSIRDSLKALTVAEDLPLE